jgi:hypothetical protein
MRDGKAEETFDIIVPDAVLNQTAVLPQSTGSTTDNVKRKGAAKDCDILWS